MNLSPNLPEINEIASIKNENPFVVLLVLSAFFLTQPPPKSQSQHTLMPEK